MNHYQPNERPIHPRCAKLLSADFQCSCEHEWDGWDGTDDGLDRSITLNKRLEARTGWGSPAMLTEVRRDADRDETHTQQAMGKEPIDDGNDNLPLLLDGTYADAGFWKESENLKTLRGDAHWPNHRTGAEQQHADDLLRLHIIDRGHWGDCSGADLDALRSRVAKYQGVTV